MGTGVTPLPPLFLNRMKNWLGAEYPAFLDALNAAPRRGLRVNTLKLDADTFVQNSPFPLGERVPWCPEAFYLPEGTPAGKHPWHLAGLYYLQDPSAMAPGALLEARPGERILDLTAAPGGKTTHIAAQMQGAGLLVANEIKTKRIGHLAQNVERWGADNVLITNETPERLADHFGAWFDRVVVDAPCSGEGMFRKDMGARRDWSPEMVQGCAVRQGNILEVAAHLVQPGGVLLYSTCTFAPEENEAVLARFLARHPDFSVDALPRWPGFDSGHPEWTQAPETLRGAVRLWPHRLEGDGHFVARLRRDAHAEAPVRGRRMSLRRLPHSQRILLDEFIASTLTRPLPDERLFTRGERLYLAPPILPHTRGLRVLHPGLWLGTFKKKRFEPAHPLALWLRRQEAQSIHDLPAGSDELAAYLRGHWLPRQGPRGWTLVCADGYPLGWGKQVADRLKNHYPRGWLQPG